MGSGGGSQTTTQTSEPWKEQKPYLQKGFSEAENIYDQGPAEYYPGNTYVDLSDPTMQGLEGQTNKALSGPGVIGDASSYASNVLSGGGDNPYAPLLGAGAGGLADTASGSFLNSNPYLDATFNQAAGRMGEQFSDTVLPGIAAQFGNAGGAGSALHGEMLAKAGGQFGDSLSNLATNIYGGNYSQERDRMTGAQSGLMNTGAGLYNTAVGERTNLAGMAPGLEEAGYMPFDKLRDAGKEYEAFGERVLEDDINRFNYEQNKDLSSLQDYMAMISGNYGGTSVSRSSGGGGSPLATGLGTAATFLSMF